MPRPPRVEVEGGVYHVTAQATHDNRIFFDDVDRARWLRLFESVAEAAGWECFSYCLLSTHYHLVLGISRKTLASGMQYLNARHAESLNRRHERRGHAFGARYHSTLVKQDSHAREALRYIALNPVRAGLVAVPEAWPWSSFAATVGLARPLPFLRTEWVLGLFASDRSTARQRFRAFVHDGLGQRNQPP
jgi:REP-associated tyrosine transposase